MTRSSRGYNKQLDDKPTVDLPMDVAVEELTGFEVIGIQVHFKKDFERLGGVESLIGTVWAYENRNAKVPWQVVENMTLKQLNGYFADKDPGPESEQADLSEGSTSEPDN